MKDNKPVETTAVVVSESRGDMVRAEDFLPLLTIQQAVDRKNQINQFVGKVMKEGEDFGIIKGAVEPGRQQKKVLLKPGAEKLCSIFGLAVTYTPVSIIEDWTGAEHGGEPLFNYEYRCQLSRGNRFMGEAVGSCNSWESKYRYRWVSEEIAKQREDYERLLKRGGSAALFEPEFALEKGETTGKYGKPAEYWQEWRIAIQDGTARRGKKAKKGGGMMNGWERTIDQTQYRIPNPDIADVVNTCQKMAQKRALVSAVLVVTNCSDAFTPDLDDDVVAPEPPVYDDQESAQPKTSPPQAEEGGRAEPARTHSLGRAGDGNPPAGSAPGPEEAFQSGGGIFPKEVLERPIPEELQIMIGGIKRSPKELKPAFDVLWQAFERRGEAARVKYEKVCIDFRMKFPKGKAQVPDYISHILDLWDELQKFPEPAEATHGV